MCIYTAFRLTSLILQDIFIIDMSNIMTSPLTYDLGLHFLTHVTFTFVTIHHHDIACKTGKDLK